MKRRMLLGLALVFATGATVMACGQCANLFNEVEGPANRPWHHFNTTVHVDARGELKVDWIRLEELIPWKAPNDLIGGPGAFAPTATFRFECKGVSYILQFGDRKDLHDRAIKWDGKTVFIKGTMQAGIITVTDLQLGQRS